MSARNETAEFATVWALTKYYAMCSEECGWEADFTVSRESAQARADQHNLDAHRVPKPAPPRGWQWNCARDSWMVSAFSEEAMERAMVEHLATHSTDPEVSA